MYPLSKDSRFFSSQDGDVNGNVGTETQIMALLHTIETDHSTRSNGNKTQSKRQSSMSQDRRFRRL